MSEHIRLSSYCDVCHHRVYSMATHVQTEEHKRNLRIERDTGIKAVCRRLEKQKEETDDHRRALETNQGSTPYP